MSNRKHGRFISRFEHTCSTSPPSTLWRISTRIDLTDHSVPQHLQGVHIRTLGLTSPSLVPARTNTHKHTSLSRPHLYTELPQKLETTWTRKFASSNIRLNTWWSKHFNHLKTLSQKLSYRIDIEMESSSMCEKTRIDFVMKNKKSLLKTLLINSPFDMKELALK